MITKKFSSTHLVYYVECETGVNFKNFKSLQDQTGGLRIDLPENIAKLVNQTHIVPIIIMRKKQSEYAYVVMNQENGQLSGFIKNLKETGSKSLIIGKKEAIRTWKKFFLYNGIILFPYCAGKDKDSLPKVPCYLTNNGLQINPKNVFCTN
jgi:hypothetical protein